MNAINDSKVRTVYFQGEEEPVERKYTKKELCNLYGISKNTLSAWIQRSNAKFVALGYSKYQKIFTKAQIQLCFDLWGEP